jgi:hypothetical protein
MLLIEPVGYTGAPRTPIVRCQVVICTLNTVVLGEGVSKSKYTPYFGHHSCAAVPRDRSRRQHRGAQGTHASTARARLVTGRQAVVSTI